MRVDQWAGSLDMTSALVQPGNLLKCAKYAIVPTCNCRAAQKHQCPLPNSCTISNVVYGATVINEVDNTVETYTGLTANPFKKRVRQHEADSKK